MIIRFQDQFCSGWSYRVLARAAAFVWLSGWLIGIVGGQTLSTQKALGHYQQLVWQDQHGLPQNGVLAMQRTRDGYLWLGTIEGAVRFDGVRFVVFDNNNTPEFKSNQVLSLAEDRAGNLWFGAVSGGLTRLQDGRFQLYTTREGLSSDAVRALLADRAGNLWIGTRGGGLNRFRDEHFTAYTTRDGLPGDQVQALAEGRNGELWIGTTKGLARLAEGRITAYTTRDGLPHERINAIQLDSAGTLWVATGGGLCRMEQGRFVPDGQPQHSSATALLEDRQHNLWVGTQGQGLFLRQNGHYTQYTVRDGLSSDTVLALYQDPEGDIWVGTVDGGLCQLREGRFRVYSTEEGLPHSFATAVFEDSQGSLWMGTNSGIGRLQNGQITAYPAQPGRPENDSITEDRAGNLWLSTGGQLSQFRNGQFTRWTKAQGLPHEPVRELLGDRAGNLWISTPGQGVTLLRDGRFRSFDQRDGLADNEVTALYEGRSGQLWFGLRNGGLSRYEPHSQRFTSWTIKEGLPGDQVLSLYEDRAGSLWVGTNGGGLCRFKNGQFTRCTVRDGLYDNRTFQILSDTEDDSGDLWISSNRGIFRTSLRELNDFAEGRSKTVTSFVYGVFDGMLSRECNGASPGGWRTRDGRLWFPTVKGVVALDPKQRNTQPTVVAIERVIVDREPLPAGQAIQLKPQQENLEIEYTGINWRRPPQIRFKYQLVGFNQDWVEAGTRRTAYFSNLPPGAYTFRVIADNGEGVWNTEARTLRLTVLPPFYRTWWFLTLSLLSVWGIFFAVYKYRINQLEQRQAAQQEFARQLIASQEAERKRIAAELHDGLGQNLLVIKNRALFGLMTPDDAPRTAEQLTDISTTVSQAIDEVRQIAANLHPYQLDRLGLTKALTAMVRKVGAAAQLDIAMSLDNIDDALDAAGQINLYRIVQEALNNIIKHAAARQVSVQLQRTPQSVQLTMRDDGRGFVQAERSGAEGKLGGLGLSSMAERARLLGGVLHIESAPGAGTRLTLTIPFGSSKQNGLA
ncbi:MAG: two-component regulator propeller domain-containing protein [Blastocatellia bacterium]